ncbi:hypothetical protein BOX15_Mlig014882g1, partial [Macrostomum lignano]
CQPMLVTRLLLGGSRRLCSQSTNEIRMVAKREMEHFWEKNRKLKRPWSPHLTIYGNSITMITSLIHRVSGIAMGLAWPVLGVAGFYAAGNWSRVVDWARGSQLGYPVVFGVKSVVCFLPVYHMINGIRHLCYDLGYGFDLAVTKQTGVVVIALAVAFTLLLASVRLAPQPAASKK